MVYSLILYSNVFIFEEYSNINLIFILVYFGILYRKKFIKYFLIFILSYYGNVSTSMLFTSKIYLYNNLIFIHDPSGFIYIIHQLINIFLIEIICYGVKSIKLLKNYKTNISIKLNDHFSDFSGYIDSGNTLIIDDMPVIFLKEKYFVNKKYKELMVKGMGERKCKYFTTQVILDNKIKNVICASGNNNGFKGCDCLVNIYLLKGDNDEIIK